jgi:hypothetical protein
VNDSSADFATSETADRLLDLHLESLRITDADCFKPYVEDLLDERKFLYWLN